MSKSNLASNANQSPFDSICQKDEHGNEFWSARDLMKLMGYSTWQKFTPVIENAKENVETIGLSVAEHFLIAETRGKGRTGLDYRLSRLATETTFNCADSRKINPRTKGRSERIVQSDLAASILSSKKEVKTIAGAIDILTPSEVIEVKVVGNWKCALGQVLVYGTYYPNHQKRIHLFGETQESFLKMIQRHCKKFNVIVTWEQ